MSAVMQPMALDLALPWHPNQRQEEKFKRWVKGLLIFLLLFFIVIPFLPEIVPEFEEKEIDIAVTQVLLEPIIEPERPVVAEPPKPVVEPPKPTPVEPEPQEPVVKKEPTPKVIKTPKKSNVVKSAPKTQVKAEKVEEKVSVRSSQGLDQLSNELSAVRDSLNLSSLKKKNLSNDTAGTAARASRDKFGQSSVTSKAGGIGVDGNLMNNESTSLSSHTTVAVAGVDVGDGASGGSGSYQASRLGSRDMESIRRTFEREKGRVYQVYARGLKNDPGISGKFIFKLTIEPSGSVSKLTLVSSGLGVKTLENDLLKRIRKINFGREDVSPTEVQYTYNFFPS